jgi:hypothetical protein
MPDDRHAILATQAKYNRSTADSWQTYASHRDEISALLEPLDEGTGGGRLCVLGAGNCNDLHLPTLLERYDEVHLVDIDAAAIEGAVKRQGVSGSPNVVLRGGVDLTGIADTLASWRTRKPSADQARDTVRRAASTSPPPPVGRPFDVVLSPCVLSQISGFARDSLGKDHPLYRELLVAIRDRHLRLLAELLRPGGTALLVCDMLSSDSFAELSVVKRDKLPALMDRLVYRGDFFPGLAPSQVQEVLRQDPLIAPLLGDVKLLRPWVWRLTPKRTFLVYAVRIRRRRGALIL